MSERRVTDLLQSPAPTSAITAEQIAIVSSSDQRTSCSRLKKHFVRCINLRLLDARLEVCPEFLMHSVIDRLVLVC